MNTLDCNAGFSLITARPAAPTCPRPIPAPSAATPNAIYGIVMMFIILGQ